MRIVASLLICAALMSSPAQARCNDPIMCHESKAHHSATSQDETIAKLPAVVAYANANKAMHHSMNISYSGNSDIDFVRGMIPHHQGAVDMALVELRYGKDEEVKALARWIIKWQETEIGLMKQWLLGRDSAWVAKNVDALETVKAYKASMAAMHQNMNITFSGDADQDFVRGMIPHHQAAVDMAVIFTKTARDPFLRTLASDIIRSQRQEIAQMQEWLAAHPHHH